MVRSRNMEGDDYAAITKGFDDRMLQREMRLRKIKLDRLETGI
jgi:hypothetical protein